MNSVKMVEVTRSNFTESTHYGVAVLINSNGEVLREWGNSNTLIYPRSALKPIQSLNLYKDGVAEDLNLSDDFIALSTASHHAENIHQKMINNWLKKINLKEKHLSCGPSWPWNTKDQFKTHTKYKVKRKIFHNCSGKHCGHLAVSKYRNLPIKNYQNKDHPIQKELIKLIEDLSKYKIKNIGVDGCTLPNPLIPLKKFALAAAQLADYKKLGEHSTMAKRIFDSCVKFPEITGGSKSINSILTKLSKGKAFIKNGAEGVFVAIIPKKKSALAVKIVDGTRRAAEVAIAGLLSELKIINNEKIKKRPIKNSANQVIGSIKWIC
ncbi:MAG: asparaginase [Pelagibacteraceae bacterium]|jgi:L-asparaginase II|nr:asparaginase [Pelagibacteraceae bacterium]|tara:strand:+ start:635 stop:1603 length:969 start_codon:yes stop_codon:yes gene_type:complete